MPNLIPFIDTSEVYDEDIIHYYNFQDCEIELAGYKLKAATGVFNGNNSHIYLLTDEFDNHLSILRLEDVTIKGKLYHQINKSYSLIKQKGYGEILYESCFKVHKTDVISDSLNTLPGSYNLWRKIINKNNLEIYRFDTITNRRYRVKLPLDDFLIWGVDRTFLDAIKNTPWDAVGLTDEIDGIDEEDDDEIFIGQLTENDMMQRTILSDFIVKALKNRTRIKNRKEILLLLKNSN